MINITPYKEIKGGEKSIYSFIDEKFIVPEKVIQYLKTTKPYSVCLGLYQHPFNNTTLCGPYLYTDGEFIWDRDTWKYVVKYHVALPEIFIDHVMSEKGDKYLQEFAATKTSWEEIISKMKEQPNSLCLLPGDAGNIDLEQF